MLVAANVIGKGTERKDIARVPEGHAIGNIERAPGDQLFGEGAERRIGEMSRVQGRGGRRSFSTHWDSNSQRRILVKTMERFILAVGGVF